MNSGATVDVVARRVRLLGGRAKAVEAAEHDHSPLRRGGTGCKRVDALIATWRIEERCSLLHADRDFAAFALPRTPQPAQTPRAVCDRLAGYLAGEFFAGSAGSSASTCATPLWQSMHVALPSSAWRCIFCANSLCLSAAILARS